jgi:hypothetical protein
MKNDFSDEINELFKWNHGGEERLDNGTILICKVPHIGPEAWFHIIYPKIKKHQIEEIEKEISQSLPEDFKAFLLTTNGINTFSDNISIYGKRTSYVRLGDEAIQPYDLADHHNESKRYFPEHYLIIGSYGWDGTNIVYDLQNSQIYRCERYSSRKLNVWENLEIFLKEEIIRLTKLFDENGIEYDKDAPTTP